MELRRVAMTENEAIKELETSIDLAKMCTQNYERKTKSKVTRWQSKLWKRCSSTARSARWRNSVKLWRNRQRFQERLSMENTSAQSVIT